MCLFFVIGLGTRARCRLHEWAWSSLWEWLVDHGLMAPHSYILLRDTSRGCLLELRRDGFYYFHSHRPILKSYSLRCSPHEVAALSKEECLILDGIHSEADRYTVYSTPGKLKWGCGLKVGDTVLARLPGGGQQYITAIVRWRGEANRFNGYQFGVEITVCMY